MILEECHIVDARSDSPYVDIDSKKISELYEKFKMFYVIENRGK